MICSNPLLVLLLLVLMTVLASSARLRVPSVPDARPAPAGDIIVHDPSGIIYEDASRQWYAYGTGLLSNEVLASHTSVDGYSWLKGSPIFTIETIPSWIRQYVPDHRGGAFWAPDIVLLNNLWHLYYAVSTFGSQTSCIGLATNPTLNPSSNQFRWTDQGPVICSTPAAPYNTIDPHVFIDPGTGNIWMNFGSFWQGIHIVQLTGSPVVGKMVGTPVNIAKDLKDNGDPIEASWVQPGPDGKSLFLFANWGQCCEGVNSTYNVRVGKSSNGPTGPYIDQAGVDMIKGGGTLLLATDGRQIGPGQVGFPSGGPSTGPAGNMSAPIISYHYYDLNGNPPGQHTLGQTVLEWGTGATAWPRAVDRM